MTDFDGFFHSAAWYDASIDWSARLAREIPLLREIFGPPGELGLLDAGCGTGRQTVELARLGYRMTGLDMDQGMLALGRERAHRSGAAVDYVTGAYDELPNLAPGPFDGIYCVGNALAACASADAALRAVNCFAAALRPGGRLFVQILNFPLMQKETPCIRGPRVVVHSGVEYISTRLFRFTGNTVEVTNVTHYKQGRWHHHAAGGYLYAISPDEMDAWCAPAGLGIDQRLGAYDRTPFDPESSIDLIVIATKQIQGF
ncbi:MAG: methyltransferase domain-containing protein [Phycisphaerae bacterium]